MVGKADDTSGTAVIGGGHPTDITIGFAIVGPVGRTATYVFTATGVDFL